MTIVLSAYNVLNYPEGGGHFWVYMQYVQGLRQLGCEVYWLEKLQGRRNAAPDANKVAEFSKRMDSFGMGENLILYENRASGNGEGAREYVGRSRQEAEAILRRADLLLNFHYRIDPALLALFQRSALVNLDPGVLESWMASGELTVPPHDVYFTIGQTCRERGFPARTVAGQSGLEARAPGISWRYISPPVSLERWPFVGSGEPEAFTTVSSWWTYDWLTDENGLPYDNNKRVSFLQFLELPRHTRQVLELALYFGETALDVEERQRLERHGWRVRHSREVAGSPEMYRTYIQQSRGEFGCAKPAYIKFQTGWISDRTICYLASGKPVVIQDTGPSTFLPNGAGMFRFSTLEEAASAFATINSDYPRHCRAAREIAEEYFDAKRVGQQILDSAFSGLAVSHDGALAKTGSQ